MAGERILVIDDSPTITKVVQLVLTKAGYQVDTAPDGAAGLAAARAQRPDAILLDFMMPKMNGYQVCRELTADAELRDIPVVLMSAKGDQVGERFVKVMGIVDYITKPFSPDAVSGVVRHVLDKYQRTDASEAASAQITREDRSAGEDADRADARRTVLAQLRASLIEMLAADAGELRDGIRRVAEAALDDAALTGMLAPLDLDALRDPPPGLRGDLRVVPLAGLLQLLDAQEQSGVLTVERGEIRVAVYVRRGRIDQVIARGVADELRLGRFVVDAGVPRAALDAVLAAPDGLLGERLVAAGHLTEAGLQACLARQSSELIYETLRWPEGRFQLTAGGEPPEHVAAAGLALDVEALLMEGYRRVDEWHLIERSIDNFEIVFLRNEDAIAQMGRGRLTRDELAVLELVDGKHTVKEIVREAGMGSFEVSKMLYRLLSIKLIRRRVLPVAV